MPSPARRLQAALAGAVATADTAPEVLAAAAGVLVPRFDVSFSAWSTVDPADLLGTSCALFDADVRPLPLGDADLRRERALFELEWLDADPNTFAALRRTGRVAAGLRADVGDPSHVARYQEILSPLGLIDELRVVLREGEDVWGSVILYRDLRPFTAEEAATVAGAVAPVGRAVRRALLATAADRPDVEVPPGTVVLDADDQVVVTSPAAEILLADLDEPHARTACVAVAAGVRLHGALTSTAVGRRGVVAFHGSPAKGLDGGVCLVVERPRPVQLAPLILRALGLTHREREVAELVLQGYSRRIIAQRLGLAEDTVDDHLQHIYRKADVPGRAALSASIFERFYAPHRKSATPGPYGWFLLRDGSLY